MVVSLITLAGKEKQNAHNKTLGFGEAMVVYTLFCYTNLRIPYISSKRIE